MSQSRLKFPHTISFRLKDEDYLRLKHEASQTNQTPHEWCRTVVLDGINQGIRLSKNEHVMFKQLVRVHYLVANGFQLVAEDRLTPEEWTKLRMFAKEKIDIIAERSLKGFSLRARDDKQL